MLETLYCCSWKATTHIGSGKVLVYSTRLLGVLGAVAVAPASKVCSSPDDDAKHRVLELATLGIVVA